MKVLRFVYFTFLLAVISSVSSSVFAQDDSENAQADSSQVSINPEDIQSLFFTHWQHHSIIDAKNSRGFVRAPSQAELDAIERGEEIDPEPSEREISLGGIVYDSPTEWTIWLNNQRVTPTALPEQIINLVVFKDYIEMRWLDDFTNQVFPLRIRSHQRFNLDTRIFLTGE